jgi:hypothetical protein
MVTRAAKRFLATWSVALLGALVSPDGWCSTINPADIGHPIAQILDRLNEQGLRFVYSTSVLKPDMVVIAPSDAADPVTALLEVLQPYGLKIRKVDERHIIIRQEGESIAVEDDDLGTPSMPPEILEETIVRASHYEFFGGSSGDGLFISRGSIERMPVIADDPIRAIQLLPGVASGGISARPHLRGHDLDSTGVYLNGNLLLEPYHAQNLQSLFSAIDSRAIQGMEVYTGSLPPAYGNHMGGVVLLNSIEPEADTLREIGISAFNTSVLGAGNLAEGRVEWVASARRGSLDLILDDEFGEPSYSDVFGHLKASMPGGSIVSLNVFMARNDFRVIIEDDPTEPEDSLSDSNTSQLWLNWEYELNDRLSGTTTASANIFEHRRVESVVDPEELVASVVDDRESEIYRLAQHWTWTPRKTVSLQFGGELEAISSEYDYTGSADYFGVYRAFDLPSYSIRREFQSRVSGYRSSAYLSGVWKSTDKFSPNVGLRWDRESYTGTDDRGRLSPQVGFTFALGADTEIHANVGRFYQAQQAHKLQVEDGLNSFFPAQRTDAGVLALTHRAGPEVMLRAELYYQRGFRLRPRFENILNPITVISEFQPDRVSVYPSSFTSKGAELTFEHNASKRFQWWASYTLANVEDKIDGSAVPRSWDQTHAAKIGLSWRRGALSFAMVATGHSGWPQTTLALTETSTGEPQLRFSPRNSDRYDSFFTLDLSLRYQRVLGPGELTLFFELANASNRENPCCLNFDVSERGDNDLILELEEEYWLPVLPNVGVIWNF